MQMKSEPSSNVVWLWQHPIYTAIKPDCANNIRIVYQGWLTHVDCILFFEGHTRHGGPPTIDDLLTAIDYVSLNTIGGHTFFHATGGLWFWSNFFGRDSDGPKVQINWSAADLGAFSGRVDLFIHAGFDAANKHDLTVPMTAPGLTSADATLLIRTRPYVRKDTKWGDVKVTGIMSQAYSVGPGDEVLEEQIFPLGRINPRFEHIKHHVTASGQVNSALPAGVHILSTVVLPLDLCHRRDKNLLSEVSFDVATKHQAALEDRELSPSTEPGGASFYDWAQATSSATGLNTHEDRYGENTMSFTAKYGPGNVYILHHCVWSERE